MDYVVYCDESRHEGTGHHRFMAIGSLWVPRVIKDQITRDLQKLRYSLNLRGEIKWSKVSAKRIETYKRIVDFFFQKNEIRFRVIVVDHTQIDLKTYHGGDPELSFYKFYYELLEKWIEPENRYLVLLDFKQNKGAERYIDLKRVLENKFHNEAEILDLTVIDSAQSPLAQLCDLLTGSVAAEWCGIPTGRAKRTLADYIALGCGLPSLRQPTPSPAIGKFNIFHIRLKV